MSDFEEANKQRELEATNALLPGEARPIGPMETATRFRSGVIAYALLVVACFVILAWYYRLGRTDFRIPYAYTGDGLLSGMLVKSIRDNGWYLHNPNVGAPGGLYYYDYPFGDTLSFVFIKLLTLCSPYYGVVLNLFFLLTFPLTGIAALYVFRRFGVSDPPGILGSLIYTFLPYHLWRSEAHLFLSAYYLVPLMVMVLLWVSSGRARLPSWRVGAVRLTPGRDRIVVGTSIAVCILVSLTGFYYAFFAVCLLFVAGAVGALTSKSFQPVSLCAVLVAVIVAGAWSNTIPSDLYWHAHGKNSHAIVRNPADAESYGLKLVQLLLPVTDHRRPEKIWRLKDKYDRTAPLVNENDSTTLGLIASGGLIALLGCLLLNATGRVNPILGNLATLNLGAILLSTVGGFGSLFAYLGFDEIRGYNRICVYIAFFAVFAVVLGLDWLRRRYARSFWAAIGFHGLIVFLLLFSIYDQMPLTFGHLWAADVPFHQDEKFVNQIEALVPSRSMIFQLPYMPFPEAGPINSIGDSTLFREYLHSQTLRWSYGAMKGSETDLWQKRVAAMPLPAMLKALTAAGFAGVYVNGDGYADKGKDINSRLSKLLGPPRIVHPDGWETFFRLPLSRTSR